MKKIPLSIILMIHNEEDTIEKELIEYHTEIIKKLPGSEFIVAEDGSKDNTRNILYELTDKLGLTLQVTPQKRGYAKSLRMALKKAKGNLVFYADAGDKHDPKDFWKLYKKITEYDLVTGYKKKRHDPFYRIFLAWGLNLSANLYFGVSFKDIDCGFKLLKRDVVKKLVVTPWLLTENTSLEIALKTVYLGFKTTEVGVKHKQRKFGVSRGLPPKKIPKVVFGLLLAYPRLKASLEQLKSYR